MSSIYHSQFSSPIKVSFLGFVLLFLAFASSFSSLCSLSSVVSLIGDVLTSTLAPFDWFSLPPHSKLYEKQRLFTLKGLHLAGRIHDCVEIKWCVFKVVRNLFENETEAEFLHQIFMNEASREAASRFWHQKIQGAWKIWQCAKLALEKKFFGSLMLYTVWICGSTYWWTHEWNQTLKHMVIRVYFCKLDVTIFLLNP